MDYKWTPEEKEVIERIQYELEYAKRNHLMNTQIRRSITEKALNLLESQQERIAIMSEGGRIPDWHFFKFRPATAEEKEYYKAEYGEYNEGDSEELQMIDNVPGDGEEVFLWNGYGFSVDTYDDGMLEREGEIEKGMAWAYLPEPPKEGEAE